MMTVGELIEHLSQYPSELRVVVNGYEDGFDDVAAGRIRVLNLELDTDVGGAFRPLVLRRGLGLGSRVRGNDGKGGAGMTDGAGSSALVLITSRYPRQARV